MASVPSQTASEEGLAIARDLETWVLKDIVAINTRSFGPDSHMYLHKHSSWFGKFPVPEVLNITQCVAMFDQLTRESPDYHMDTFALSTSIDIGEGTAFIYAKTKVTGANTWTGVLPRLSFSGIEFRRINGKWYEMSYTALMGLNAENVFGEADISSDPHVYDSSRVHPWKRVKLSDDGTLVVSKYSEDDEG